MKNRRTQDFFLLSPESILDAVEGALQIAEPGIRATGRSLALNSLENRVYDVELDDDTHVVAKFYRPGRWTKAQILEEHAFLFALEEAEIPVVAPIEINEQSLFQTETGILFSLFDKVRGRMLDELDHDRLRILGRYIARIHNVGEHFLAKERLQMNVQTWGRQSVSYLLQSGLIDPQYHARYHAIAETIFQAAEPFFARYPAILLHGDCHLGNTLWQNDAPFFLDFDDCMRAPAVQDIWMVVRGRGEEAERDRDILLEGYEVFRPFDRTSLGGIEILRSMRMMQYSSWIARRWEDPSFHQAFPYFSTPRYWEEEINSLQETLAFFPNF